MFRYANDDKVIEIVGDLLLICKDDPEPVCLEILLTGLVWSWCLSLLYFHEEMDLWLGLQKIPIPAIKIIEPAIRMI